jgi:hypothetical protein
MFPRLSFTLPRPFPMYAAFPRSEYLWTSPTSAAAFASLRNDPFRSAYSIRLPPDQDHGGSLRSLDAPISEHAVPSDPAAVSGPLALYGDLLLPSGHYDSVGLRILILTRLNSFTCVTACSSLCLRLAHVVTFTSPRLDSRWGGSFPFPGREFHPLGASGLS